MRLLIVTDAWQPQVNGVVRTITRMREGLEQKNWEVKVVSPSGPTLACPTYPEIRLTLKPHLPIASTLAHWMPEHIHIATEGPLAWAMRRRCLDEQWAFTTSFHTRYPEYLKIRFGIPKRVTYAYLRKFHAPSSAALLATPASSLRRSSRCRKELRSVS